MIAYLDASALLRLVLREPGGLEDLRSCDALVSSELLAVEALRTIDRLRLQGALSLDEAASRRVAVADWLEAVDLVLVKGPILAGLQIRSPRRSVRSTRCTSQRLWCGATGCDRRSSWRHMTVASRSPRGPSGSRFSAPDPGAGPAHGVASKEHAP